MLYAEINFIMEFIASFSINSFYQNLAFFVAETLSYNVYYMEQKKIKLLARPIIISSTGRFNIFLFPVNIRLGNVSHPPLPYFLSLNARRKFSIVLYNRRMIVLEIQLRF